MTDDEEMEEKLPPLMPGDYDRLRILNAALPVLDEIKMPSSALRMVLDAARDDAADALSKLVGADPFKPEEIRELQWQVTRYDSLCTYVGIILESGREATEDLTQDRASELERLLRGDEQTRD